MDRFLHSLFAAPEITGSTINTVPMPRDLTFLLYLILPAALIVAAIVFMRKGLAAGNAIRNAVLVSFLTGGILYAAYAESVWARWIVQDWEMFAGKTTEEKLLSMDGSLYAFSHRIRALGEGRYSLHSSHAPEDYYPARLAYFLLPMKKDEEAPLIVVIGTRGMAYDDAARTLHTREKTISGVVPVFRYSKDAYVLYRR